MAKIKLGLVGVGKIARDQHLPVLATSEDFELVAVASRNASVEGVPSFACLADMLDAHSEIEAISLCTPPAARMPDARLAIARKRHLLLEKPPTSTLSDAYELIALSQQAGVAVVASWHSRHAPGVAAAREWLHDKRIASVEITWKENVRIWHPCQDWIFEPGGLGVFDPGINALSIATFILPNRFALVSAELEFPSNRQAPIAARLSFRDREEAPIEASFGFTHAGDPTWTIDVQTKAGRLTLAQGGESLLVDGTARPLPSKALHHEYKGVYAHFADLVRGGRIDIDIEPLLHVADAYLVGRRVDAPPFLW